jgi:histidinol dehydrogenase
MRRANGLGDTIAAIKELREFRRTRIFTSGGGLYKKDLTPEDFARRVIDDVRRRGDSAVKEISTALDGVEPGPFEVPVGRVKAALNSISSQTRSALERATDRVRQFQEMAMPKSWMDASGQLGEEVRPLGRAGVYVPGGTAPLASSVIMTVVPARVAGVSEIVLVTPSRGDSYPHEVVLAAAAIAGADRVFRVGGAQAIAALAYGTETIPAVDVICGPGNIFVTAAKKLVFGDVGVDGLYGPTETAVIADESADPTFAAADLLAQAEHDVFALPVLISMSKNVADRIEAEVSRQMAKLPRRLIAENAVRYGISAVVASVEEAIEVANALAPEHLCVSVKDAARYLPQIRYAGGIFLGEFSAEVMADYVAGPSHVMPTGGTARFASALSVRNFVRISPFLNFDEKSFLALARDAATLAHEEGLDGHAAAAELRQRKMIGE